MRARARAVEGCARHSTLAHGGTRPLATYGLRLHGDTPPSTEAEFCSAIWRLTMEGDVARGSDAGPPER